MCLALHECTTEQLIQLLESTGKLKYFKSKQSLASFNQKRWKKENYAIPNIHEPFSHNQDELFHVKKHICSIFWCVQKCSHSWLLGNLMNHVVFVHPELYKFWSLALFLYFDY